MNPDDSQSGKRALSITPGTVPPSADTLTEFNHSASTLPKGSLSGFKIGDFITGEKDTYRLVYEFRDVQNGRNAIFYAEGLHDEKKVIAKAFSGQEHYDREKTIQKILQAYSHKNLHSADELLDEQRMVISPYTEGGDLRDLVKKLKNNEISLTPYQAEVYVVGLLQAIQHLHQHNIVHRDIKSGNIILDLADFPVREEEDAEIFELPVEKIIPKLFDYDIAWHPSINYPDQYGKLIGTPKYVAPEIINGIKNDPRSDIYSAGVVLYELFTGECPFESKHIMDLIEQHLRAPVPKITEINPHVGADLQYIIEKAMAKNPDQRYQTAGELLRDFLAILR